MSAKADRGKRFRASLSCLQSQECDTDQYTDSDETMDGETDMYEDSDRVVMPPSQDPGQEDSSRCRRNILCRNAPKSDDIVGVEKALTVRSEKPAEWTIYDVKQWATYVFNEDIANNFQKEEVDGSTLLGLKDNYLDMLGLNTIGKKAKFANEVAKLKEDGTPLQVIQRQKVSEEVEDFAMMDRVLTNSEKDKLTSSDRSTYNTKKKKSLHKVKKRWLESEPTPWFRNNSESTRELQDFVEILSADAECVYPAAGLKRIAIEEIVRRHMQERRRKKKDLQLTSGTSNDSSISSSPEPSTES